MPNVNDAVEQKLIELKYCPSEKMYAYSLTKPLTNIKHAQLIHHLSIVSKTKIEDKCV